MDLMNDERKLPVVLAVDDTPENLTVIGELLEGVARVKVAHNGEKALRVALASPPDLILLDVMMPIVDGYTVCRELKSSQQTREIPIIFLTAKSSVEDERHGLELGAVDYITKPISPPILLARVHTHLAMKRAADFLRDKNSYLAQEVERRIAENLAIQNATIQVVTSLAETRDPETGNHIRRTQNYVRALALQLSQDARYASELGPECIDTLYRSAPLHDIGKVGIPDQILLKPGKLTPEEFAIMKQHALLGVEAIERAERQLGMEVDFLRTAKQIAGGHHEKWDGSGYPQGLRGDAIPLAARLMAVADVYDALISRRVYKEPMPHMEAMAIMHKGRATHFDPAVLDAFVAIEPEIRAIAQRYADTDEEVERKQFAQRFVRRAVPDSACG